MIDLTPSPIAFSLDPLDPLVRHRLRGWVAAVYLVISHEARWRGLDVRLLPNAMIVVAAAALVAAASTT